MSYNIDVYVKHISDGVIHNWLSELKHHGFKCEIHPDFIFKNQSGFLPFKLRFAGQTFRFHIKPCY